LLLDSETVNRVKKLQATFATGKIDGYLVLNNVNQLYFIGVPGTAALLISEKETPTVYVYGVNYEQAKAQAKNAEVKLVRGDENLLLKIIADAKQQKISQLTVDALGLEGWRVLSREFPTVTVDASPVVALRTVKDAAEIELMRKAADLTSQAMQAAAQAIKPGVRECEVAGALEYAMRRGGGGPTAFESIVASGPASAYPHGGCSVRKICEGDLVMVDIGATYNYYCSDMTRTFVAGNPTARQQKIYEIVKAAQDAAFEAMQAGTPIASVDTAARQVIAQAGFGELFVHRIGHGVGLEVHEPPSLHALNKDLLVAGNVVTDEPGIYVPDFGGIRIEDTVLIGARGPEKLTVGEYSLSGC
jgi:Xaa-Pro aminopeptidase